MVTDTDVAIVMSELGRRRRMHGARLLFGAAAQPHALASRGHVPSGSGASESRMSER